MVKPLFYSALFGSGLLVGALVSQQPGAQLASAAGVATRYECVGFSSDDNGKATVSIFNMTDGSSSGTVKWYDNSGSQVSDNVDFDVDGRGTVQESTSKKGVVHASIKANGPILVDGRLQSDKMTVGVKCSPRTD